MVLVRHSARGDHQDTPWWPCVVSIDETWKGSLHLVLVTPHDPNPYDNNYCFGGKSVTVAANGVTYTARNIEDLKIMGLQGTEPQGSFQVNWQSYCFDFKICPGPPANVSGPWCEQPWTCNILGDPCDSACTQHFSDLGDADADGDLHDGHPLFQSSVGESFCGPCRCGAGEAQSYVTSTLCSYTPPLPLISCSPCAAGRFKDDNNTAQDDCEVCRPGSSSTEGATACAACGAGWFNNEEFLDCVSCPPGHFGDGTGQTTCQECTVDPTRWKRDKLFASHVLQGPF